MTRRNPPAKWVLPDTINPEDRLCVTIQVPNDFQHRAAFWGAMQDLGSAAKWADDPLHKAREVAQVWREIINETIIGDCLMPIIFRDVDCDIIEFSLDGGETWELLANFSNCFISKHPYAPSRNEILPTGDYPNLILTPASGQTSPLFASGVINIYPAQSPNTYGVITGSDFHWSIGGAQLFSALYGDGVYFGMHPFLIKTVFGNKVSIGGYYGYPAFNAQLKVENTSVTYVGIYNQAVSGQDLNMLENRKADGTLYSGYDWIGRPFLPTVAETPTDMTAKNGTMVIDVVNQTIPVKFGDGWKVFQQMGPQGEPGETGPQGEPGETGPQGEPGENGITFKYQNRRNRPLPGATDTVPMIVRADERVNLPWLLENGDIITIDTIAGWWGDATEDPNNQTEGYDYLGDGYYSNSAGSNDPSDPFTYNHMQLIFCYFTDNVAASDEYENNLIHSISDDQKYGFLMPNSGVLDGNYGAMTMFVSLNVQNTLLECGYKDFSSGKHGWAIKDRNDDPLLVSGGIDPEYVQGGYYGSDAFYSTYEDITYSASPPARVAYLTIGAVFETPLIPAYYEFEWEVLEEYRPILFVFYRKIAGTWISTSPTTLDSSLGTHIRHAENIAGETWEAILFLMIGAGDSPPENPTSWKMTYIDIGCEE